MDKPLISKSVPSYKIEVYFAKGILSIVGQTYKNPEIILGDDGFLDNCSAICDDWAERSNLVWGILDK